jgi:Mg2+-importing ATPase
MALISSAEVLEQPTTSEKGLTSEEACERLGKFGPNEPVTSQRTGTIKEVLLLLANPLVLILLIATGVTAFLAE